MCVLFFFLVAPDVRVRVRVSVLLARSFDRCCSAYFSPRHAGVKVLALDSAHGEKKADDAEKQGKRQPKTDAPSPKSR